MSRSARERSASRKHDRRDRRDGGNRQGGRNPNRRSRSRSKSRKDSRRRSPSVRIQRGSPSRDRVVSPAQTTVNNNGAPSVAPSAQAENSPAAVAEEKRGERITVILSSRPFGMAPAKEDGVAGYVISKMADGKPAQLQGVQVGWRVVAVAERECRENDNNAIQALLKDCALPVQVVFETPPLLEEPSDSESEGGGDGILDDRAELRMKYSEGMDNMDELPIKREPEGLPEPIKSWTDAVNRNYLNRSLFEKLQAAGLKRPTPIQRHAIPIIGDPKDNGYDLVALAQTGSGKTFAFVIPTVARLVVHGATMRPHFPGKSPGCPLVLVLSPTRELAMQTYKEIEVMTKGTKLTQTVIYGGESLRDQTLRIDKGQIDILCATPGRLIDLIDACKISLSFVQSVVLDEADQMLEQSLEVMCAEILIGRDMPGSNNGRQTLLFSATMPSKIQEMCSKILRPHRIGKLTIGHYSDDQGGSCKDIQQILRWAPDEKGRVMMLVQELRQRLHSPGKRGRAVVFTNMRVQAGYLEKALNGQGIPCVHLHGKLDQHVREEIFDKFRRGVGDVLVATNVASRGLDFPDISLVVQFALPQTVDIYTHRIGRTGRVGQVGCALAFVGPKDRSLFPKLVEFLELNNQEVPHFLQQTSGGRDGGRDRGSGGGGRERSPRRRGGGGGGGGGGRW